VTRWWLCLSLGGALACVSDAAVAPGARCAGVASAAASIRVDDSTGWVPAPRWILVYAGSTLGPSIRYRTTGLRRLVTHVDTAGNPQYWAFSGAIFLHLYAPSGRVFTTWIGGVPANGADWTEYLDSLFVPGAALSRLDSAVALGGAVLGALPEPFRVSIMIPYPDPGIGSLDFGGQVYDFGNAAGRGDAAAAYIHEVVRRFQAAGFAQLRLDGFYWLLESAPALDVGVITRVAGDVHAAGLRFLWIPYYAAEGWTRWRDFGFDAAWLQPNYFFDPGLPASRLDSAAARAEQNGMGLEVEFDGRLWADSMYCDRLQPYLTTLANQPPLRAREIAVYEGSGALIGLSFGRQLKDRALYQALGDVLR